ncbi:MAG TPA: MBL fold metallo-hydrolase [Flavobacterium sp.]|nr:MBL fold metallo-hydrolase [Flavobacterium sp.]
MGTPHQIVSPHRNANSFVLPLEKDQALIVDVGNFDPQLLEQWLALQQRRLVAAVITHEHSDHCMGLADVLERYRPTVYCSSKCAQNMADSRQNFSHYMEEVETFTVEVDHVDIHDGELIEIGGQEFVFTTTPGHSPGGICFHSDTFFFSGDTLLEGKRTPLSFPHSSKADYVQSITKLEGVLKPGMTIFPGHGSPFLFTDFSNWVL